MADHLQQARHSVQAAADAARANIREQLLHVDEGLMEQESGDKTQERTPAEPDALKEIETKLVGLSDQVDDPEARARLQEARTSLDRYRQARGAADE